MTHEQAEAVRAALGARRFSEDIIQSVFVGLLEAERKVREVRDYVAFAVTLAHRRKISAARHRAYQLAEPPSPASMEPEQLRRAEARQELRRLIEAEERATKTARVRR